MALLPDLIDSLTVSSRPLADALRSAKVLAARLNSPELGQWVDRELNGYGDEGDVPQYRKITVTTTANFSGMFGAQVKNVPVPSLVLPDSYREMATTYYEMGGVAAIESALSHEGTMGLQWNANIVAALRDKVKVGDGYVLTDMFSPISKTDIVGVLDTVRNKLLSLLLEIERENPAAGDPDSQAEGPSPERVNQIFHTNIYGSTSGLAIGSNNSLNVTQNVIMGDFDSVRLALKGVALSDSEIDDLWLALENDGTSKSGFGTQVAKWMGDMVAKASSGAWNITVAAAGEILGTVIASYLGLSSKEL